MGITYGTTIGDIKGDTRSLDMGSFHVPCSVTFESPL